MDLSFAALCHGRSSTAAVSPCAADAAGLPLLAGTIDLLVCTEVLEHVADLDAVLTELHRVVRSGGFCIVSSPNYLNPMGLRKWFKDRRLGAEFWDPWGGHQGYERLMLPSHVDRALRKHFAILEIRGAGFLMAWTALGYGRIGRKNDRHPWLALGRAPVFRNIAMNRYLLLKRKVAGNERI
jgi:SAM-dependent methyltransferase